MQFLIFLNYNLVEMEIHFFKQCNYKVSIAMPRIYIHVKRGILGWNLFDKDTNTEKPKSFIH